MTKPQTTWAVLLPLLCLVVSSSPGHAQDKGLEWVRVSKDQKGFVLAPSGRPFVPWGFNYDHDETGRLLEGCSPSIRTSWRAIRWTVPSPGAGS
jgi:hypothetical protein